MRITRIWTLVVFPMFGATPLRAGRRFYRAALLTVMGLCECLLAIPASAQYVPPIPNTLPAVGAANGFTVVRYTASGSATATTHTIPVVARGRWGNEHRFLGPLRRHSHDREWYR